MERVPMPLLRPVLRIISWFVGALGLDFKPLGLERSPFGSAMITSVGMFGLQIGFAPLAWLYRVPLLVLVGEVTRKPVAEGDEVEIRPMLPITASIDHRFADGAQIAELVTGLREYLGNPRRFEPARARPPRVAAPRAELPSAPPV
jgi:pyruvate dehydrogenase E2 component (dihydrolipoamide acetyltransferase)